MPNQEKSESSESPLAAKKPRRLRQECANLFSKLKTEGVQIGLIG
jgi:hypothetical protein